MFSPRDRFFRAVCMVAELMRPHGTNGHGVDHIQRVLAFCKKGIKWHQDKWNGTSLKLTKKQIQSILFATLLHDVDDPKLFDRKIQDYKNARFILKQVEMSPEQTEEIIYLISLVSASTNQNTKPSEKLCDEWKLYPRYADRLDALGARGIWRAYQYAQKKGNVLFTETTPRPRTMAELNAIVNPERFQTYRGNSNSLIDHFYDKLLHQRLQTSNLFFASEAEKRVKEMENFVLQWAEKGTIHLPSLHGQ